MRNFSGITVFNNDNDNVDQCFPKWLPWNTEVLRNNFRFSRDIKLMKKAPNAQKKFIRVLQ